MLIFIFIDIRAIEITLSTVRSNNTTFKIFKLQVAFYFDSHKPTNLR